MMLPPTEVALAVVLSGRGKKTLVGIGPGNHSNALMSRDLQRRWCVDALSGLSGFIQTIRIAWGRTSGGKIRWFRLSRNSGGEAFSRVDCQAQQRTEFSRTFDCLFWVRQNEPSMWDIRFLARISCLE
jgi:hypothetical protein